ncbi:recombinase [Pseudomonas abyssi]|uniref:Recombinase n=4 Tax=Pseudomonadaceae TaxID=135621 RepID=A0A2A3MDU0_9PSED|nr:integrase family protein [Pseudomonas abyssi]MAC99176.1 recombinase [Pseudomonadales bacterium]PBK02961.1 recombinase [Pseudomonas abyssi]|tara:strand:+ start:25480 stop:27090 length:1611 start_codon:yes stop_codon:yes gene_type:complete
MIRALFSFQINKILLISWQFWLDRQEIEGWAQMGSAGPKVSMKVSMGFHQGAGVMGLPGAQMSSEVSMDFTAIRFSGVRKVAKAELQFTHDAIRALECSAGKSEQIFYDKTQRGLALRVTARGAKTFVVIKRVNGTMKRITISKYDSKAKIVSIRDQAAKLIGEIDEIIEREKLDKQSSFVTVESTFEKMMKAKQRITQATREDYRRTFKNYLSSIADVSLGDFDYEDVIELHASITKPVLRANGTMSKERKRAANKALGLLGSIYRFAIVTSRHEGKSLITSNPVEIMREMNIWHEDRRSKIRIEHDKLASFINECIKICNDGPERNVASAFACASAAVLFMLFTGVRPDEVAKIRKAYVNHKMRAIVFPERTKENEQDTLKNGEEFHLMLNDTAYSQVLFSMKHSTSRYVFSGIQLDRLPESVVRDYMMKIGGRIGQHLPRKIARATFISIAESSEIGPYQIKVLCNHDGYGSSVDVTDGYKTMYAHEVRAAAKKVEEKIYQITGCKKNVVCRGQLENFTDIDESRIRKISVHL